MRRPQEDRLRTALIVLSSIAVALGILTYFVVFFPTGSYQPVVLSGPSSTPLASSTSFGSYAASSTVTSTLVATTSSAFASSTPSSTTPILPPGEFATEYSYPYPVTWNEGNETFSVTGASLEENQLTVSLSIQVGTTPDCVPVNIRLIADENGDQEAPNSPSGSTFIFPDTQTCTGTAGATYSEPVVFTIDPNYAPFLLTTGGTTNTFFQIATTTAGGLDVSLPSDSD